MRSETELSQFLRIFLSALTVHVFCERLSICVCAFLFGFAVVMLVSIVLVPVH